MNLLDTAIISPDDAPEHPIVKRLGDFLALGDNITLRLETDSSPLYPSIIQFIILRKSNGIEQPEEAYDWDDELNTALINLGIKAVDIDQESMRFSRGLRAALRKVERRFGDGYMNSVLVDLLNESDLGNTGEIRKFLNQIHVHPPQKSGRSYATCRDIIANEIGGRAKELKDKLKYNPDKLKTIMDQAIARYIDERFSISSMRRLGWIDANGHTT